MPVAAARERQVQVANLNLAASRRRSLQLTAAHHGIPKFKIYFCFGSESYSSSVARHAGAAGNHDHASGPWLRPDRPEMPARKVPVTVPVTLSRLTRSPGLPVSRAAAAQAAELSQVLKERASRFSRIIQASFETVTFKFSSCICNIGNFANHLESES